MILRPVWDKFLVQQASIKERVRSIFLGQVRSLVYWDNPRDSGIVCGSLLVCLLAVRYISLIRFVFVVVFVFVFVFLCLCLCFSLSLSLSCLFSLSLSPRLLSRCSIHLTHQVCLCLCLLPTQWCFAANLRIAIFNGSKIFHNFVKRPIKPAGKRLRIQKY